MVNELHAFLLGRQYIAPRDVKEQIAFAIKSWKRFEEDFGQASNAALAPLWGQFTGGPSGPYVDLTLFEVEKLRGHYKHLRQFAALQSNITILSYL